MCSSDLGVDLTAKTLAGLENVLADELKTLGAGSVETGNRRSEERRVGKECRSRWSPYH